MIASCGDGFIEAGVEQCDGAGVTISGTLYQCSPTCRIQRCGNGIIDPTEQCDNDISAIGAAPVSGDGCSATCRLEFCGDGIVTTTPPALFEQCDPGTVLPETASCDRDCTTPSCGDSVVNHAYTPPGASGPEQCDPPSAMNGCSALCRFERCGNGVVDPGEQCDGAAGLQPCSPSCFQQICGNGILDPGEQCDNGGANSNSASCKANCTINTCGDGHILAGTEGCDNGAANGATRACTDICQPNVCGDGKPHTAGMSPTEQCDDGNTNNNDACTNACTTAACGDAFVQSGELCDFGPGNNMMAIPGTCPYGQATCAQCAATCSALGTTTGPYCGDGMTSNGEACDDGNSVTEAACPYQTANPATTPCNVCSNTCTHVPRMTGPYCGDGSVNAPNGAETCDLGAGNTGTCTAAYNDACVACSSMCISSIVLGPRCGDGMCNNGETAGTCGADCMAAVPGAPTSPAATAGVGQATVTFTAPASDGGATITGYTATSSPGGFTGTAASSPITVTGLANGTAYTFTVVATNSAGNGPASVASNSINTPTAPGAPTIGTATATATPGELSVTFTAGSTGGSPITMFNVACLPSGAVMGGSSPLVVTGLNNMMMYTCTVTATNAVGTGSASAESNSATPL